MISINIPKEMQATLQGTAEPLPWIWLLELELDTSGANRIVTRLANKPRTISWKGKAWAGVPFALGQVSLDDEGSLQDFSLVVSNATREASRFVQLGGGLAGRAAQVILTHERMLADGKFVSISDHRLGPVTITDEAVVIPLQDPQLMNEVFPIDRFMRDRCSYPVFGDSKQCLYQGTTYTTCPRTPDGCAVRGEDEEANGRPNQHPARGDFFPGLSTIRL